RGNPTAEPGPITLDPFPILHWFRGFGSWHLSSVAFRKVIRIKPDDVAAYNNLGNALADQKTLVEAEAAYRKAITLQPDDALAYSNLGALLCDDLHRPAEAEAAFRKAIELQPDYANAYF